MTSTVRVGDNGLKRNEAGKESNLYTKRNNSPLLTPNMHKDSDVLIYDYKRVLGSNRTSL